MKKIDLTILRNYFKGFAIVLGVVSFVMYTINANAWTPQIAGKNIGFFNLIKLTAYLTGMTFSIVGYPISTLLAAVINMKEFIANREIIAIRNAGLSEIRILTPLIIIHIFTVISMYLANAFMTPKVNEELAKLLFKIKKTNPMIDIKEGVFYNELKGYSIKVNKKLLDEKGIEDIIIYDHTEKKGNVLVTLAKSGELYILPNEKFLVLNLRDGYSYFEKSKTEEKEETEKLSKFIRNTFKQQKVILDTKDLGLDVKDQFKNAVYNKNSFELEKEILGMKAKVREIKEADLKNIYDDIYLFINSISTEESSLTTYIEIEKEEKQKLLLNEIFKDYKEKNNQENILKNTADQILINEQTLQKHYPQILKLESKIRRFRIQHFSYILEALLVMIMFILGSALGLMSRKGEIKIQSVILVLIFLIYYFLIYNSLSIAEAGIMEPFFAILLPFTFVTLVTIYFTKKALKGDSIIAADYKYYIKRKFKKIFSAN